MSHFRVTFDDVSCGRVSEEDGHEDDEKEDEVEDEERNVGRGSIGRTQLIDIRSCNMYLNA